MVDSIGPDHDFSRKDMDESDLKGPSVTEKLKASRKRAKSSLWPHEAEASSTRGPGIGSQPIFSKRRRQDLQHNAINQDVQKSYFTCLPPEILIKVFLFGVQSEGFLRFLPRVSQVCKEWRNLAADPSLLKRLDLSANTAAMAASGDDADNRRHTVTKKGLEKLFATKDLSLCRVLSLAWQTSLSVRDIKAALLRTPHLASLDLRGCQNTSELLEDLPGLCPRLERLDLSQGQLPKVLPHGTQFVHLVTTLGPKLVELRLARKWLIKYTLKEMLHAISQACPLLEELDLSVPERSVVGVTVRCSGEMEEMMQACPRLRELRLNGYNCVDDSKDNMAYSPGFSRLVVFSETAQVHTKNDWPMFYRMFADNNLVELDVSRTNLLPSLLKVRSVKKLYLANMRWNQNHTRELKKCMVKWSESIEVLDLSRNSDDLMFLSLPDACSADVLQVLNLSHTAVQTETVVNVLRKCKSLRSIDLTSCWELPIACQKAFSHEKFSYLFKSLHT